MDPTYQRGLLLSADNFVGSMGGFRPSHGRFWPDSVSFSNASGVLRKGKLSLLGGAGRPPFRSQKVPKSYRRGLLTARQPG